MIAQTYLKTALTISVFFVVLAFAGTAHAKIIYVDDDGTADFSNIQAAIDEANPGDVIIVSPGTYHENINFRGKAITVTGTHPHYPSVVADTVISADGIVVTASNGSLLGFTIRGSTGVYFDGYSPTIRYCRIIASNFAIEAYVKGHEHPPSTPLIENNVLNSRSGMFLDHIYSAGGVSAIIRNNVIIAGDSGSGTGIYYRMQSVATITGNIITNFERGIYFTYGSKDEERKKLITHNDVWGNTTNYISQSTPFDLTGTQGNISADPMFADPTRGDYRLLPGSPCIDAGDPDYLPNVNMTDWEGEPRLMGECVDIGVDEFTYEHGTFLGIDLIGPDEVHENSLEQYLAVASYDDGSNIDVTTMSVWSLEPPGFGSIDAGGLLNTDGVTLSGDITIRADYAGFQAQVPVQVRAPVGLEIIGPPKVRENCTGRYKAIAQYDQGDTRDVTHSALWMAWPQDIVGIDASGLLQTYDIDEPQHITVQAEYAGLQAQLSVLVHFRMPYTLNVPQEYETIQAAIDVAIDGDTVVIAPGTYTGEGNRDIDPRGKAVTIRSIDPDDPAVVRATVINCQGTKTVAHRGFKFQNGEGPNCVLAGLTIINGYANSKAGYDGGGIYCLYSSPTITKCIIADCSADLNGGGIYCLRCDPIIINCTITGNVAHSEGGGIGCSRSRGAASNPLIANCTISNNIARYGGAIARAAQNSKIINGTIADNSTSNGYGGGLYCCDAQINNCVITGNSSPSSEGSGLFQCTGPITNSTLIYNTGDGTVSQCPGPFTNCIIWGNPNDAILMSVPDVVINYSCIQGWNPEGPGTGNTGANPKFLLDIQPYLSPDSPCIDAGTNFPPNGLPATDIDGNPRVIAVVDMGAYEYNPAAATIVVAPAEITFNVRRGESNLHQKTLTVGNAGGVELTYELTEDCPWLTIAPTAGTLASGELDEIIITVDPSGITHGAKTCVLIISDTQTPNRLRTVTVELKVTGPLRVPQDFGTIQHAIDAAIDGDIVLVSDGVYRGLGNKDLNLRGKAITLRSEAGPKKCIIDCQNFGRAFYFHTNETKETRIDGFTITNAWSIWGAGIYCRHGANPTITNCILKENSAAKYGGALFSWDTEPNIIHCTFTNNSASRRGGAMYSIAGSPTFTGCTFIANMAGEDGSGMYIDYHSSPTLTNCLLTANAASGNGGTLNCARGSTVNLTNCILWGNSATQMPGYANVTFSDIPGGHTGQGNIDADPCFMAPGYWDANGTWSDGDYHLLPTSPCIDAGDPNYIPEPNETDLDGDPRVMGVRIDMGAYESPLQAEARIVPRTINLASKGKSITCYIWLPEDYNVTDIDPNSIVLENGIEPDEFSVKEERQVAVLSFSREDVQAILDIGETELTITGRLTDGNIFEGTDTIKVIDKSSGKPAG